MDFVAIFVRFLHFSELLSSMPQLLSYEDLHSVGTLSSEVGHIFISTSPFIDEFQFNFALAFKVPWRYVGPSSFIL